MPVIHTGHTFSILGSVFKHTELNSRLVNIGLSSELQESVMLNSPMRLVTKTLEVKLPDGLVENLYAIYHYNTGMASWQKITGFKRHNNKLILPDLYQGILLAFPFDSFKETLVAEGDYVYEMYLSRLDSRVYRNITISTSSYTVNDFLDITFSIKPDGPWKKELSSPFIIPTFYMKINVHNKKSLQSTQVIPSELINITCLTCE